MPPERRVSVQGLRGGWWQHFLAVAGMTAVITSVLAGAGVALLVAILSGHSLVAALVSGGAVGVAALVALTRRQHLAWRAVEAEERARADASL